MAMELLPFYNQLVSDFLTHNKDDHLVFFHIIQGTQVPGTQLKLCQGIGAQPLDGFRGRRGLLLEPQQNGRLEDSLIAR
jgi:hypothetical protein